MEALSFWPSVALEAFKALFTAVLVGLGAGVAVWKVQDHTENLRTARGEALQRDKSERDTKTEYVRKVADLAGSFFFLTQRYYRQKTEPDTWGARDEAQFDRTYVEWASQCEGLERELGARFGWDSEPRVRWHQVRDLLTVRYFQLRDKNTMELRRRNAPHEDGIHSGLSVEELENPKKVLDTFHETMSTVCAEILSTKLFVVETSA